MKDQVHNFRVSIDGMGWLEKSVTRCLAGAALLVCGLSAGCGQEDQALMELETKAPFATGLDTNAPFVIVPRATSTATKALRQRALHTAGAVDSVGVGDDFYLAINKKELGSSKWTLSSYLKQYFPGAVSGGAARSMGTRVVSFRAQNGRLFVFDTDNRKQSSDVFNPDVLVEAYPVVSYPPFDRLPGSSQFVLFDPANGLNDFAVLGDAYAGGSQPVAFKTELSYMARYRTVSDGITFEQVFTGYADKPISDDPLERDAFHASGTLGIGLRRYAETMGYKATPVTQLGGQDIYFRGDPALVSNAGAYTQGSVKWAVSSTRPVEWVISNVVDTLQANPAYAGYDIYGAMAKGVTNWNTVFGYDALKVRKGTTSDSFADDDTNMIIVDTDPSFGAAFANWRNNPNTGEIRGASVYINSLWLEIADIIFADDPPMPLTLGKTQKPKVSVVFWRPAGLRSDGCTMWAPIYEGSRPPEGEVERGLPVPADTLLTKKQKVEQYLTHVVLHEVGHTLGLRHNFKGSLKYDPMTKVYSSSVMEYMNDSDAVSANMPGTYDIAAIKYLYGMSMSLPADKFCNDGGVASDPDCTTFDRTNDPYANTYLASYLSYLTDFLDGKSPVSPNNTLNFMQGYVRNGSSAAIRMKAWNDIVDQTGYSLRVGRVDATKLRTLPDYGARVDQVMSRAIQRLFLDDASLRGRFTADPQDAAIVAAVFKEATAIMKNTDGIRSASTRRMLATWFKKLQTFEAFDALTTGAAILDGEIRAGKITDPKELAMATDTLKYMDKLLSPYFN